MKKNCTKTEIKHTAREALLSEYGFAPKLSDITLLEASGDRSYILFGVKGKVYRFQSPWQVDSFGYEYLWVGQGTIEKVS